MYLNSRIQLRIEVLTKYLNGQIKREDAWTVLEVSERHFDRMVKNFKEGGFNSLLHGNINKTPSNKLPKSIEEKILHLFKKKYLGLNITHFYEKLLEEKEWGELDQVPCYSTVRRILTEKNYNKPRPRRPKGAHKSRNRYQKEGIMLQIDGSHHEWFGNKKCCLIVGMDDATGKIAGGKFSPTETSFDTMDVLEQVLNNYGRFQLLYSDKAGIYDNKKREGFTSVTRALKELDIMSILANSPQAKGRIERAFGTLQSRLVSELRIRNIRTIDEANKFLPEFIEYFNKRFAVEPECGQSAYRPLPEGVDLNQLFCMDDERVIHSGNRVFIDNEKYVITSDVGYHIKGKIIEIKTYRNGTNRYFVDNQEVQMEKLVKYQRAS